MSGDGPIGDYDRKAALVVTDVQNDFADPGGNLYVEGGEETISLINAEIEAAKDAGAFVVYTQDWHPDSTPHFSKDGGIWPVHCVQGTKGAEFHPDLRVDGPVVRKGVEGGDGYSGFSVRDPRTGVAQQTDLDGVLKQHGIERLVVVGLAQDYCVKDTVLDGLRNGYRVTLLADATRPVNQQPGDGARAIAEMVRAGAEIR